MRDFSKQYFSRRLERPLCFLNLDGEKRKSRVVKKNINPQWMQTFRFPCDDGLNVTLQCGNQPSVEGAQFDVHAGHAPGRRRGLRPQRKRGQRLHGSEFAFRRPASSPGSARRDAVVVIPHRATDAPRRPVRRVPRRLARGRRNGAWNGSGTRWRRRASRRNGTGRRTRSQESSREVVDGRRAAKTTSIVDH